MSSSRGGRGGEVMMDGGGGEDEFGEEQVGSREWKPVQDWW